MKSVEMTDLNEGIIELYAEHLLKKASSVLVSFAVGGTVGGALIGAVPGLLSHSVISPGTNYFAVLLGAIAGGFLGRSIGDKRAVGLRLQAQMALHQLQIESRLVAAPAPAPVAAPVAPPPVGPALVVPPPARAVPPTVAPAPAPLVPAAPAPPVSLPEAAPAAPLIRTEPTPQPTPQPTTAPLPAVPRLVEPPALPPLSQLAPPLRIDSTG
jgi:hypothetical protein